MTPPYVPVPMTRYRAGVPAHEERVAAEEVAVAVVHDASTYAVMMATPQDLEDFAIGLSLTEGVIGSATEVQRLEIAEGELGVEVRMWLDPSRSAALATRRRTMAGPTGCGLCGVESLEMARHAPMRPVAEIAPVSPREVYAAMKALEHAQPLGQATRAMHAAGFWTPNAGLRLAREDVGRHNAVDKLVGAMARGDVDPGGMLLLTSRVSVELVQKAAAAGIPVIVAVSAPTILAIRTAEAAGIILIAVARADGFEIFTRADWVRGQEPRSPSPGEAG